ncbi:hypothetical protein N7540_000623 [Penicillium herquei]|nr:hypothetical protein N7540_000623 [Penicillium herquei]
MPRQFRNSTRNLNTSASSRPRARKLPGNVSYMSAGERHCPATHRRIVEALLAGTSRRLLDDHEMD